MARARIPLRAIVVCIVVFIWGVCADVYVTGGTQPAQQCEMFRGNCICSASDSSNGRGYDDCTCAANQPCDCGTQGRCLCTTSEACDCQSQDCFCGKAKKCTGRGLMFCSDKTAWGYSDCDWTAPVSHTSYSTDDDSGGFDNNNKKRLLSINAGAASSEDDMDFLSDSSTNAGPPVVIKTPAVFCVPDPSSWATLPDCFKASNLSSVACRTQYACKKAITVESNPEIVILPVMAFANICFAMGIFCCNWDRCKRNMARDIPVDETLGQDMQNLTECTCTSWLFFVISPAPFLFTVPIMVIFGAKFALIPFGFSCMILQFIGPNVLKFEPRKNVVSHYKYFCCCVPFLWDRVQLSLLSNRSMDMAGSLKLYSRPDVPSHASIGISVNCCCECEPTAVKGRRIKTFMDEFLRPLQPQIDAAEAEARERSRLREIERRHERKARRRARRRRGEMWDTGSASALSSTTTASSEGSNHSASVSQSEAPPTYRDVVEGGKYCTRCGVKQKSAGKFCHDCGHDMTAANEA